MLTKKTSLLIGKCILAFLLLVVGILLIRRVCYFPKIFSVDLIIWLAIGLILILLASFLISGLLYPRLKIARSKIFAIFSIVVLLFLSFGGRHASLYSFVNRIGDNGIVPNTEIVIKEAMPNGIAPKEVIDITDNYLRTPFLETSDADLREKYIKIMYRDSWMKKVVICVTSYSFFKDDENIYKLPFSETYDINEKLYQVSLYFGSVLHKEDNRLIVYIDGNGNVAGTGSYILE